MPPAAKVDRLALFFVASPLHYLAALKVAAEFETQARKILVWYDHKVDNLIEPQAWDDSMYMPWPRFDPLPGFGGRHRRLLENLRNVSQRVGQCKTLILHSPVFDTEAINYLLHGLKTSSGASESHARILPDGLLNIGRYPLSLPKRLIQQTRRLRSLISPTLRYTPFDGDRIGSEAPFVDRIYVLNGFDHDYPPDKVVTLGPLVQAPTGPATGGPHTALVVGQPLVEFGLMDEPARARICHALGQWLSEQGMVRIHYKAHPRETTLHELREPNYELLEIDVPLEAHMAQTRYDIVAGCCSTALFTARQIYGADAKIAAFGLDDVFFKGDGKRESTYKLMQSLNIDIH